ncbi:hypothetical protein BDN72DRAFT_903827 [Pluteus cervinus]|uniref:Uncharacterized protein n=1 Tax=Pluteus cervinus TaxID=181527 RepID=A0ACD3A8L4_9AGAR|nr:hypothetical protein BDN72DRAFT_903827 [Pluteus cervinus]
MRPVTRSFSKTGTPAVDDPNVVDPHAEQTPFHDDSGGGESRRNSPPTMARTSRRSSSAASSAASTTHSRRKRLDNSTGGATLTSSSAVTEEAPPPVDRSRDRSVSPASLVGSDDSAVKRKRSLTDNLLGVSPERPAKIAAINSPSKTSWPGALARTLIAPFFGSASVVSDSIPMEEDHPESPLEDRTVPQHSSRRKASVSNTAAPYGESGSQTDAQTTSKPQSTATPSESASETAAAKPATTQKARQKSPVGEEAAEMGAEQSTPRANRPKSTVTKPTPTSNRNRVKSDPPSKAANTAVLPQLSHVGSKTKRKIQNATSESEADEVKTVKARSRSNLKPTALKTPLIQDGASSNDDGLDAGAASTSTRKKALKNRSGRSLQSISEDVEMGDNVPSNSKGKNSDNRPADEGRRGTSLSYDKQFREMTAHLQGTITGSLQAGFTNLKADIDSRLDKIDRRLTRVESTMSTHSELVQPSSASDDESKEQSEDDLPPADLQSAKLLAKANKRRQKERKSAEKKALKAKQRAELNEWKSDAQIQLLRNCVRQHIRSRLGIDDPTRDLVGLEAPSAETIEAVLNGDKMITLKTLDLAWGETKKHGYNQSAVEFLTQDFITCVTKSKWYGGVAKLSGEASQYIVVFEFAETYVENLLRTHKELAANSHADRLRRSRRNQRKIYLSNTRRATVQGNKSLQGHLPLMDLLGSQAASSDESDAPQGPKRKVYRRLVPVWRSNALGKFLGQLDLIHDEEAAAKALLRGKQPQGSSPHTRQYSGVENKESKAPEGLPLSCYDCGWYTSLTLHQKKFLRATTQDYKFTLGPEWEDIGEREPDRSGDEGGDNGDDESEGLEYN